MVTPTLDWSPSVFKCLFLIVLALITTVLQGYGEMACGLSDIVDWLVIKCLFLALITSSTILYHGKMACGFSEIVDLIKLNETTLTPTGVSDFLHHHDPPATIMYTGGMIRALVGGCTDKVEAIGFHDGKVHAVGSRDYVKTKMERLQTCYQEISLPNGQALIPGLIEPHVHIIPTAIFMTWNDFGPFEEQHLQKTYNIDYLKQSIANTKSKLEDSGELQKDGWILGTGVDPSLMNFTVVPDGLNRLTTLEPLVIDEMEPETPVFMLAASGHTAYVNTPALCRIYRANWRNWDFRKKFPRFKMYKWYVHENRGLQEIADIIPAFKAIPPYQLYIAKIHENLNTFVETALSRGVTLLYDAGSTDKTIYIIDKYLNYFHTKKIRIGYAKLCNSIDDAGKLQDYHPMTEFKNNYHGSVKLISDGSNQGLTGYQSEYYRCEPENNTGLFNFPSPYHCLDKMTADCDFTKIIQKIVDKGWPLMIHANGDKAIDLSLDAYQIALKGKSGIPKRHRIEHCSVVNQDTLNRMHSLGISPSFLIGHVGYWGYVFKKAIFEEKANRLDLCQSALKMGMRITLHSDCFVTPLGPLRMMEQAIMRIMEGDQQSEVLNECEKITPEQALKIVTYNAAWQCHADKWVGSLEEGKMADYVILAEDPIARGYRDPVGMRDIPVLETWVEGRCVYKNVTYGQ